MPRRWAPRRSCNCSKSGPDGIDVPRLSLSDYSAAEYPGLMLDVARQNNTLQDVRNCVELCRLYKVRYLHLHLNDMESFMFPSKLFPKLGSHNGSAFGGPKCKLWDRDELLATIKFADERGVAIVPELETVFHTGAMMQDMPSEFGGPGVLNIGSEKLYQSLEPLIEEMCDVFESSPFFQIGCDEASIGGVMEAAGHEAIHGAAPNQKRRRPVPLPYQSARQSRHPQGEADDRVARLPAAARQQKHHLHDLAHRFRPRRHGQAHQGGLSDDPSHMDAVGQFVGPAIVRLAAVRRADRAEQAGDGLATRAVGAERLGGDSVRCGKSCRPGSSGRIARMQR